MTQYSTDEKLERQVKDLYKLAKERCDDESLQLAVDVIKTMRRSRGKLKSWNQKYREGIESLHEDIQVQEEQNLALKQELNKLGNELRTLALEKQRLQIEKQRAIAELRDIEIQVKVAAQKVQSTKSLRGKFDIVWCFLQTVFFSDDPQDFGKIDNSLEVDQDKPQMGSGVADTQRSLRD
ncbi:hypothetical protein [[Limnothrix rosea] IAM M-220]|uniref:hypothetical protein n=1 Tax=[Limnothrix rosea] IAM M-220 TaxID=454133 RepID=UPI000965B33A|nr:hypothetical protein [[Limnothrix rosea] IAM M-220]OKH18631.1 hypothetical protein NIES208_05330 [[Limnothrix rosea] IAM M-220]